MNPISMRKVSCLERD